MQPVDEEQAAVAPVKLSSYLTRAILYGLLVSLFWGGLFGTLSMLTIIFGIIGGFAVGIVIAAAVATPYPHLTSKQYTSLFPIIFIFTIISTLLIILLPFIILIFQKDPDASLGTAVSLAWTFYLLSLANIGSSLIITVLGFLSGIWGFFCRRRGLKVQGKLLD